MCFALHALSTPMQHSRQGKEFFLVSGACLYFSYKGRGKKPAETLEASGGFLKGVRAFLSRGVCLFEEAPRRCGCS